MPTEMGMSRITELVHSRKTEALQPLKNVRRLLFRRLLPLVLIFLVWLPIPADPSALVWMARLREVLGFRALRALPPISLAQVL